MATNGCWRRIPRYERPKEMGEVIIVGSMWGLRLHHQGRTLDTGGCSCTPRKSTTPEGRMTPIQMLEQTYCRRDDRHLCRRRRPCPALVRQGGA